jgi:hypothetical protein
VPQKIFPTAHTAISAGGGVQANHKDDDGPIMTSPVQNLSGSGVHGIGMASDVSLLNPILIIHLMIQGFLYHLVLVMLIM